MLLVTPPCLPVQTSNLFQCDKGFTPVRVGMPLWTRDELAQRFVSRFFLVFFSTSEHSVTQFAISETIRVPFGRTLQPLRRLSRRGGCNVGAVPRCTHFWTNFKLRTHLRKPSITFWMQQSITSDTPLVMCLRRFLITGQPKNATRRLSISHSLIWKMLLPPLLGIKSAPGYPIQSLRSPRFIPALIWMTNGL